MRGCFRPTPQIFNNLDNLYEGVCRPNTARAEHINSIGSRHKKRGSKGILVGKGEAASIKTGSRVTLVHGSTAQTKYRYSGSNFLKQILRKYFQNVN